MAPSRRPLWSRHFKRGAPDGIDSQGRSIAQSRDELARHPLYRELLTRLRRVGFFALLKEIAAGVDLRRDAVDPSTVRGAGPLRHGHRPQRGIRGDYGGGRISHVELYRNAMSEFGADRTTIDCYVDAVRAGADPLAALETDDVGGTAKASVSRGRASAGSRRR